MEEIHSDVNKMMANELNSAISVLTVKDDSFITIRPNYGVGILPSLFGMNCSIVDGNMPWVEHKDKDALLKIIDKGIPDMSNGYGQRVIECYEFYNEMLSKYPKAREIVRIYQPDLQGPFDVAHLMLGSEIFMEMYDDEDFVHGLISLVCDTYVEFMKKITPYLTDKIGNGIFQWREIHGGNILLRNDTAVCISLDMYKEYAQKYDKRLFDEFGGGAMHFCGKADQWLTDMIHNGGCSSLNFGYIKKMGFGKEYLDKVLPEMAKAKLPLISYIFGRDEISDMRFSDYCTGVTFAMSAKDETEGIELLRKHRGH
jgi:uroporphyrinogen-III decarboxylase